MAFGAYLFDLDGTLIDSIALILASFHHTRQAHFGDRLPDDDYLATLGMPLRDSFAKMTTEAAPVEALVRTYVDFNLAKHDSMVTAYEGIVPVVHTLHERGARLAIVTSKMGNTAERGLRIAGLEGEFELIVSADDVTRGKPDPEPVLLALSKLGCSADETLFVGDSPHDVESGNAAGVRTAAATWGPFTRAALERARPTFWVDHPREILAL
jgi:pyrophosphatase PpaX